MVKTGLNAVETLFDDLRIRSRDEFAFFESLWQEGHENDVAASVVLDVTAKDEFGVDIVGQLFRHASGYENIRFVIAEKNKSAKPLLPPSPLSFFPSPCYIIFFSPLDFHFSLFLRPTLVLLAIWLYKATRIMQLVTINTYSNRDYPHPLSPPPPLSPFNPN